MAIATPKEPKKKHSLLPVLTVLFVISYGLMTMLIVEQGSVIQSQRGLIRTLWSDSTELWSLKGKAIGDRQAAKARAQNSGQAASTEAQSPAQNPSAQAPSTQAPSTQGKPQQHAASRAGKGAKPQLEAPPVPAADLADHRRALLTI